MIHTLRAARLVVWPLLMAVTACGGTSVPVTVAPSARLLERPQATQPSRPGISATDTSFATLLNNVRISSGAGSVTYDSRLDAAAQGHANALLAEGRFSHLSADGRTVGDRATAQGYDWQYIAENIAQGQATVTEVFDGWQQSGSHRDNNLDPRAQDFGLGSSGSGAARRWVLVLGAE